MKSAGGKYEPIIIFAGKHICLFNREHASIEERATERRLYDLCNIHTWRFIRLLLFLFVYTIFSTACMYYNFIYLVTKLNVCIESTLARQPCNQNGSSYLSKVYSNSYSLWNVQIWAKSISITVSVPTSFRVRGRSTFLSPTFLPFTQ